MSNITANKNYSSDHPDIKHIKDCELGDRWESCPACVFYHNQDCDPDEEIDLEQVIEYLWLLEDD